VSHWSVASVATVKLITGAFDELKNDPTIGRAVALRRAEMAMLDPKNPPEFAHPLSGRRSCSLAKVAREGKIDRSEMAIRGISAGGLRRSPLVRQTAGYGAKQQSDNLTRSRGWSAIHHQQSFRARPPSPPRLAGVRRLIALAQHRLGEEDFPGDWSPRTERSET